MNTSIPPNVPLGTPFSTFLRDLTAWVLREFNRRTPERTPLPELLLYSPDKSVWRIEVANDGAITSTKVSGP